MSRKIDDIGSQHHQSLGIYLSFLLSSSLITNLASQPRPFPPTAPIRQNLSNPSAQLRMHFSTAVLILASSLALGAHALPQTPPALPLSNSTSCSWGDIATPNAYYVANCQYAAKNSSDGLSYIAQPSFVACLSSCDTNAACNAIAFFPYETGSNLGVGEGYCYNFASYDETANYWTAGSPMIIRGNGAVAKYVYYYSFIVHLFFTAISYSPAKLGLTMM